MSKDCFLCRFSQMVVASLTENIARRVDRSATDEEVPKNAYEALRLKVS